MLNIIEYRQEILEHSVKVLMYAAVFACAASLFLEETLFERRENTDFISHYSTAFVDRFT